jgi:hypothetical protein
MDSGVTMSIWDALVQGGIAIVIGVLVGIIVKIFIARTFKGIDDKINSLEHKIENNVPASECKLKMDKCEKLEIKASQASEDIIRLQEATKILDTLKKNAENIDKLRVEFLEKYQPKADFIREMQILNSQLESAHKMITRLDEKIETIKRGPNGK